MEALFELAQEANDPQIFQEVESHLNAFQKKLTQVEFEQMLSGEHDPLNAILSITPGAGGTESQDWAQILLRMYVRWAEKKGFKAEVLDFQAGEEAGIKGATIGVTGPYAYGYLKAEAGVHRLVRISPFSAQSLPSFNSDKHLTTSSSAMSPLVFGLWKTSFASRLRSAAAR